MKTVEELYGQMRDTFAQETGMTLDETGEPAVRMYALAAQIYGLYQQAEWTRRQCFPQTAVGEDLDKHAWMRSLTRGTEQKAVGSLRFSVQHAARQDLPIPQGTVCTTAGLVAFETTEEAVLLEGRYSVTVPAQAVQPGPGGNVPAGAVRIMTVAPAGISDCLNEQPFTGGTAAEDDETLRRRILDTYQRLPNGTNAAYYEQEALRHKGVAAVCVLPRNRGLGTVDLVISGTGGMPSEDLLREVREDLEQKREIAVDVSVLPPTKKTLDLLISVKPKPGLLPGPVQERVKAVLTTWFDGRMLGKEFLLADLGQKIYETEGVANYRIDQPSVDVLVRKQELPVLGYLSVEELR